MWLLLALLLVPLIEIGLFIQVGGLIGLWPTLAVVVLTAVLGAALLRRQGLAAFAELRGRLDRGEDPAPVLAHGALILVAGVLLLTPGFFTDAVGFALLIPAVRGSVIAHLGRRLVVAAQYRVRRGPAPRGPQAARGPAGPRTGPSAGTVIEGEWEEAPEGAGSGRTSGWTRPPGG